jgi:hypothetical protein
MLASLATLAVLGVNYVGRRRQNLVLQPALPPQLGAPVQPAPPIHPPGALIQPQVIKPQPPAPVIPHDTPPPTAG